MSDVQGEGGTYPPTEIPGVEATEPGDKELFRARKPYEWAGEAVMMLAFAVGRGEVPQHLKDIVPDINYGANAVLELADEKAPLAPSQIAASVFAHTIVRRLADMGYVSLIQESPES